MNVLDRLDQEERETPIQWRAHPDYATIPRAHLRALLDVARAAQIIATKTYPASYIGRLEDGTEAYGSSDDASRFAAAALAPLLKDTE